MTLLKRWNWIFKRDIFSSSSAEPAGHERVSANNNNRGCLLSTVSIISQVSSSASSYVLAMEHDAFDILGHTGLPISHGKNSDPLSFSMSQWIFIGVVLFVIYIVAKRLWKRALVWQEQSYKLWACEVYLVDLSLNFFHASFSELPVEGMVSQTTIFVPSMWPIQQRWREFVKKRVGPTSSPTLCSTCKVVHSIGMIHNLSRHFGIAQVLLTHL